MKYIKKYERIVSNTSTYATTHPLYEFSRLFEKILNKIKKIDNYDGSIIRLYFSQKPNYANITLSYMYNGWILLEIILTKFDNMENVGMNISIPNYFTEEFNKTSNNFLNILKYNLKEYKKRDNKKSERFDFNMSNLPEIMENLNIDNIIEELILKNDTNKYNL